VHPELYRLTWTRHTDTRTFTCPLYVECYAVMSAYCIF